MDKPAVAAVAFVAGVASVYVVGRIYRNRIRESIANSVTAKVSSSVSTIIPGVPINITPDLQNAIASNISYPVADGVCQGLMLG